MNHIGWPSPTTGPMTWPKPSRLMMAREWRKKISKRLKRMGVIIFYSWILAIIIFSQIEQPETEKYPPRPTLIEQIERLEKKIADNLTN